MNQNHLHTIEDDWLADDDEQQSAERRASWASLGQMLEAGVPPLDEQALVAAVCRRAGVDTRNRVAARLSVSTPTVGHYYRPIFWAALAASTAFVLLSGWMMIRRSGIPLSPDNSSPQMVAVLDNQPATVEPVAPTVASVPTNQPAVGPSVVPISVAPMPVTPREPALPSAPLPITAPSAEPASQLAADDWQADVHLDVEVTSIESAIWRFEERMRTANYELAVFQQWISELQQGLERQEL